MLGVILIFVAQFDADASRPLIVGETLMAKD